LMILEEAGPDGMAKHDFTRRTQFMDARQRDSVLRTLQDARSGPPHSAVIAV